MEGLQPSQVEAHTQTDLLRFERAAQTLSSRELQSLEVSVSPESRGGCRGCKCAQLNELFKQVALWREELIKQRSIQESEWEIDKWYYALTCYK